MTITDCGVFDLLHTPEAGYWYNQPDKEAYSSISAVIMVRWRLTIVAPLEGVVEQFVKVLGTHVNMVASFVAEEDPIQLDALLKDFSTDVILVAPACKEAVVSLELPATWSSVALEKVVLESRPAGALTAVQTQSWLANQLQRHLDGAVGY